MVLRGGKNKTVMQNENNVGQTSDPGPDPVTKIDADVKGMKLDALPISTHWIYKDSWNCVVTTMDTKYIAKEEVGANISQRLPTRELGDAGCKIKKASQTETVETSGRMMSTKTVSDASAGFSKTISSSPTLCGGGAPVEEDTVIASDDAPEVPTTMSGILPPSLVREENHRCPVKPGAFHVEGVAGMEGSVPYGNPDEETVFVARVEGYLVDEEQERAYRQRRETELSREHEARARKELARELQHAEIIDPKEIREARKRAKARRDRKLHQQVLAGIVLVGALAVAVIVAAVLEITTSDSSDSREEDIRRLLWTVSGDALNDESTTRYEAFTWLVKHDPMQLSVGGSNGAKNFVVIERYIMALLYFETGGPASWRDNLGFLGNKSVCEWWDPALNKGVGCHNTGTVYSLHLDNNYLVGTLPDELSALDDLESISMSNNNLHGSIPPSLEKLRHLDQITLRGNGLTGTIPDLSNLKELKTLEVQLNSLTGPIPQWLTMATNLRMLNLGKNRLTGTIPSFKNLLRLERLILVENLFEGKLPASVGSLPSLESLVVVGNLLSGTIPSDLGKLEKLYMFHGNHNLFSGTIPTEIGLLHEMEWLGLSHNDLTGTIPSEIGHLSKLVKFQVRENDLTGVIPSEISQLRNLKLFEISNNTLTGNDGGICFGNGVGFERSESWGGTLDAFSADCGGPNPEVVCPCCTQCCDDMTGICEELEENCHRLARDYEDAAEKDRGTVCECDDQAKQVACKDNDCMYCDESGNLCYIDAGPGIRLSTTVRRSFSIGVQYVRGRDELVSFHNEVLFGEDNEPILNCSGSINGEVCDSCQRMSCPDGFTTFHLDCTNVGYGQLDACTAGDDPFYMLWGIITGLLYERDFPVRYDCVKRNADGVTR